MWDWSKLLARAPAMMTFSTLRMCNCLITSFASHPKCLCGAVVQVWPSSIEGLVIVCPGPMESLEIERVLATAEPDRPEIVADRAGSDGPLAIRGIIPVRRMDYEVAEL